MIGTIGGAVAVWWCKDAITAKIDARMRAIRRTISSRLDAMAEPIEHGSRADRGMTLARASLALREARVRTNEATCVLLTLDGRRASEAALPMAVDLARDSGGDRYVLRVVEAPAISAAGGVPT